jgi:hypothetical protein
MAGLAPLGATPATTTQQLTGTSATVPGTIAPTYAAPPQPSPAPDAKNFTAFPSSYAGFGTNGSAYGTPGVVNGKLSIVAAPPTTPAPPSDPGAGNEAAALKGAGAAPATGSVTDAAVQTPPVVQTPPPPKAPPVSATPASAADATASQPVTLQKTDATDQKVANESKPALPPTAGLLGSGGPPPIPGGTAVENNPALGLLGAPPTNPIVIQADKQEAQAAEAAAAAASAQAAEQAAAQQQLQQVDFRISAARADNNEAAVAQLEPAQQKLTGEIQGQTFAGVGSTPPPSFARPEIPTVFLNIAS